MDPGSAAFTKGDAVGVGSAELIVKSTVEEVPEGNGSAIKVDETCVASGGNDVVDGVDNKNGSPRNIESASRFFQAA